MQASISACIPSLKASTRSSCAGRVPEAEEAIEQMGRSVRSRLSLDDMRHSVPGADAQVGDSVSGVKPVETFGGEAVIEGMY
ncbi:MAG: hypothetical protein JWR37_2301 [Mycobacterium sp.]|nr:hypothetical protein [Mycobacterium sp.]